MLAKSHKIIDDGGWVGCLALYRVHYSMSLPHTIVDKLYSQIGKVFRLYLRVEPFAALF